MVTEGDADATVIDTWLRGRSEDRLVRFAVVLTLGLTGLRLVVSGQFDLFFDEAYYWLWSTQLATGYYDHPPMVAFIIRAGTSIFGHNEFGVRFFGVICSSVDVFLVFLIMEKLFDSRMIAARAAILMNITTISIFSIMTVPDQPMILFWLLALYGLSRVATGGSSTWWLLVGMAGGLAAASKLTSVFLALAIPLWLAVVPSLRCWFRTLWIYAAALVALVVFLPVLFWNSRHEWASFALQYGRPRFPEPRIDSFLQYLSLLPLMIGPVVFVLASGGLIAAFRSSRWRRDPAWALLVFSSLPLFLYLGYHSLGEWIGAHWVAPMAVVGAMLGSVIEPSRATGVGSRIVSWCRRGAVPVGLFTTVVIYGLIIERTLPIPRQFDFMERFRGWEAFAADIEAARIEAGAAYIIAPDYAQYALLRFYDAGAAPIVPLGDRQRWDHFGSLATLPARFAEARGLYVGRWNEYEARMVLADFFSRFDLVRTVDRPLRPTSTDVKWVFAVEEPLAPAMPIFSNLTDQGRQ